MLKLKEFRSLRSDQMTMNLPRGNDNKLPCKQRLTLAPGQSAPQGNSLVRDDKEPVKLIQRVKTAYHNTLSFLVCLCSSIINFSKPTFKNGAIGRFSLRVIFDQP